jgi:YgiT-type zinc finger domain-containing protein
LDQQRVRHYYRVGTGLVVMDAVPAHVCDQCGHRYFDAEVAVEMERLSRRRSRLKDRVSFPRVRFTQVGLAK